MLKAKHRINSLKELELLDPNWGAEVDLRSSGNQIILQHDPFQPGPLFESFLQIYSTKKRSSPLILNTKEDGLEEECMRLCLKYEIDSYFFIDLAFPSTIKLIKKNCTRGAVRFSEYEPLEFALRFRGAVEWVWIDQFSGEPPSPENIQILQEQGFRICLVSPELHGYDKSRTVDFFKTTSSYLRENTDAVCTKFPELWG